MVQLSTIRKPTWTYSALAAATILVVLAAIYQPYAGLLLALLAIVLVPLLLVAARAEHRVAPTTRRRGSRRGQFPTGPYGATSRPLASYSIVSADGEEMQVGWVVPVEHAERLQEHRLVMTTQGYMLADDNGRIIHTFK